MGGVLRTDVHVNLPDHSVVVLKKGSVVPAELEPQVTNPKAYVSGAVTEAKAKAPSTDAPVEPPREGKGSGDKAWVAYGEAIGLDVSTGKKADIIAALDARTTQQSNQSESKAYAEMTDLELADLARERELPDDLGRDELIEALEFDDLEREEAEKNTGE